MAEYAIVYAQKKEIVQATYKEIFPEAQEELANAKDEDVLMLQIKINFPKTITKALVPTEENLVKITQIATEILSTC